VFELRLRGFSVVLAHPERNYEVQERPQRLERLAESGVLMQLTAASLDGRLGPRAQKTARRLLDLELAHLIASDAHAPEIRRIGMTAATARLGDESLAHWLTDAMPAAIVAGAALPERPERMSRRFGRPRLGG
jgi:protein-tyrosine phosphatase